MIAACPKCGARYRIERERLEAGGVRLRCGRCDAVFRVRRPEVREPAREAPATPAPPPKREAAAVPPPAPQLEAAAAVHGAAAPAPAEPEREASGELVLVAMPDDALARRTAEALAARGLRVLRASDGVEAMLEIQRKLPRALVLAADLPKMYGFQICEVVKRNESLRGIWVVLVGAIHHRERYRRAPGELYGADAYVDGPELPGGLVPLLARGGLSLREAPARGAASPARALPPATATGPRAEPPAPVPPPRPLAPAARPEAAAARAPAPSGPKQPAPPRGDGLDDERAKAERLARIVVSDIVLYNEERFRAAVRSGNVLQVMAGDLDEGRQLFEERIDARVRAERDHLKDELLRRAQARGAA